MSTVTHFGHACLLVETDAGARILIDPGTDSHGFESLRDLTAVLITHQHEDHVDVGRLADVMAANPGAVLYADHETAPQLESLGVRVATPGDTLTVGPSSIKVLGGTHAHIFEDWPQFANNAYLVDDGAFYHPGDSYDLPIVNGQSVPVDVLAVPISGPWVKLGESIAFVRAVAPRVAVPMHEGALVAEAQGQAHFMIGLHKPEATAYTPLELGVRTPV